MESLVINTIKKLMRSQRISYSDLSHKSGVSASRLKRTLNMYSEQSMTIADLNKICVALELEMFILKKNAEIVDEMAKLNIKEKKILAHFLALISSKR